jgi:transcriptional regulator with XRE-family HTH domain
VHARPIDVPATLRAARRHRRLSQRELAEIAGVPRSTVDRIESGDSDPRVGTFAKLLAAIGVELVPCIGGARIVPSQIHEEYRDILGRHLPPHWEIRGVTWLDNWWGWWRKHPNVKSFPPTFTYWKPRPPGWGQWGWLTETMELAARWQDAT